MIGSRTGLRLLDGARVLLAISRVELARRTEGPVSLVRRLRAEGVRRAQRGAGRRSDLRSAIATIDRFMPGGANCFRRALLEIALDPDSAKEPLFMGLAANGGPRSGHAWLGPQTGPQRAYDAIVSL